ncbi:MAG TPA: hypothetical protein VLF63_00585, partial [Patescibacteria group bacterium]|nr:hypothetical protein [Patescibacteria group bacterium]
MFPTFPDFIPLNIELKDPYNSLVKSLPPYSDISFATLQTWWNLNEKLTVSLLNQNLIINYNQPFKSVGSGLSLIGTNNVDNSIETIFQY